ncbi:ABC transporter ATP-binding protein [Micromonospora sp. DR5-3]|uniref:ABC transporter ATP-binding protein n=1 Tax=unclassified Micromonospora TaxID=2617518 RepID=UPI0011D582C8|nr:MULTISPECIES: ABC transporter ATP-binding protein [unclassified Micromonospora]MCW3816432.1 ABC transporter ATP-binding protein [Micromonospora sp. DR5-3]TYC21515.1 ABC transporter ATP-binding protein [Micromonospora sp. MP36]
MSTATAGFSELRLDGVSRRFGSQDALSDLDLTIRAGEFIALLGPSGCGKSTALNCLAGLLPLTAGSIWQDERRVDTLPPERRGFGMVFQSYALFPHMSVRGNIAFGLRMRRLPKDEIRRRTAEAVRLVRLEEHADKLPGQLSGGQQQRVAIARAVVLEPSLVLMDEPLSNLDAKLRLEMRTEIRRLHQSLGLTTVYVTHDQEEALSLADRLVVLRGGRVQQIGSPEELHTRPGNWHVADFMGYRNLWPMRAQSVRDGLVTVEADGLRLVGDPVGEIAPGDAVVAGVRPEDVQVDQPGTPDGVPAEIEVVEYQGRELAAEARTASGLQVHVRTEKRLAPGDAVSLRVSPRRLLIFPTDPHERPPAAPGDPADAVVKEPGLVG